MLILEVRVNLSRIARLWLGIAREIVMRKLIFAFATIALLAEPAVALPINPIPAAPVVSDGPIVNAAYGHMRRATRRTVRRVHRRHY